MGGGSSPAFPTNTVVVWDCKKRNEIARIEWSTEIMSVKYLRNYLFIGVCGKVFVYDALTFAFIKSINDVFPQQICVTVTAPEPPAQEGVPPGWTGDGDATLVTEGKDGRIKMTQFPARGEEAFETREYKAHEGAVVCVAVSADGRYCATASEKGTLIRIFSKNTGEMLKKLYRGSVTATIKSITFSLDNAFLAVTSDRGTAHIFATGLAAAGSESSKVKNTGSMFWFTGVKVTQSEWSSCSVSVGNNSSLCFIKDSNGVTRLIVAKENGEYLSYIICINEKTITATEEGTPVNLLTFSV